MKQHRVTFDDGVYEFWYIAKGYMNIVMRSRVCDGFHDRWRRLFEDYGTARQRRTMDVAIGYAMKRPATEGEIIGWICQHKEDQPHDFPRAGEMREPPWQLMAGDDGYMNDMHWQIADYFKRHVSR